MPKKTRKEKLISAERKKNRLLQQLNHPITIDINFSPPQTTQVNKSGVLKIQEKNSFGEKDEAEKKFFIQDLRKSLLLIIFIIALEIIIYFGTINNYLRLGG